MSNELLETFMLMVVEKKKLIELNNDKIINSVLRKDQIIKQIITINKTN